MSCNTPRRDSFDECDMSGLLEDLKFRNNNTQASSGSNNKTSTTTTNRPSMRKQPSHQRLSFRKKVRGLRDSFQKKNKSPVKNYDLDPQDIDKAFDEDLVESMKIPQLEREASSLEGENSKPQLMWMSASELV
jgi:hypothetical protein